jgi:PAS domain S-box-containing protein
VSETRLEAAAARDSRARILLVDDRAENLFALEAILEPLGHELVRASSGEEALRQVLRHDFACILLDVQMPGMNGFETAELIKSRDRSRHTPILFLTAISKEDEYVFHGYSVGAVDYMFKPFNPDILRSKVSVFVDLYLKTEQLKEQEARLRDVERRELQLRHTAEIGEREARMAQIVGSAMEAILTFGDDRRVTLFNAAAERTFGIGADAAVGRSIDELFTAGVGKDELERVCGTARGTGGPAPRSVALTGRRADGSVFPVEASISCLRLEAERVFTVIARDVSERKRQEEALRQQAVSLARTTSELQSVNEQLQARQLELESAMSARSRFYASMSHELRTPINAILGYSALLLDNIYGPLNPEQARGIERANKAARHLLELVNDILDLSKIEAGKLELEIQPATFPSLIHDLFVTVRPLADEHGSELALEYAGEEPVRVITDPRRVRQILLNLLSNAIKFGEGKAITVSCRPTPEGGVVVDVTDRGIGIHPEDLDKIFDEFVQLSQPNQHQGTGLGLPISRRLAKLLSGSLEVSSTLGEGSTFTLTLPAKLNEAAFASDVPFAYGGGLASPAAWGAADASTDADAADSETDSSDGDAADPADSDPSDVDASDSDSADSDAGAGPDSSDGDTPDAPSVAEDAPASDAPDASPDTAAAPASDASDGSPEEGGAGGEEGPSGGAPEEGADADEHAAGAGPGASAAESPPEEGSPPAEDGDAEEGGEERPAASAEERRRRDRSASPSSSANAA